MSNISHFKILVFIKILLLVLIVIPDLVGASPIDIMVGSTGSFPWHENEIKPGSHGSTSIDLINNGTLEGALYIWVENISQTDAFGNGAALGKYMYFGVAHPHLISTVPLPSRIDAFPTTPMNTTYIVISPVRPGETITLNWTWEFVETGQLQNDAQGDSLRFDIFYMLVNGTPLLPTVVPTARPWEYRGEGGSSRIYSIPNLSSSNISPKVSPTEEIPRIMNLIPESTTSTGINIPAVPDYRFIMIIGFFMLLIAVIIISQRKKLY